jgi:pyruvate,water dikinase
MFTLDTETGFPDVVRIEGAWGLGELVVKGIANPDAYMLFKPLLGKTDPLPVVERTCGAKATKMILSPGHIKPTRVVATSQTEREALVLNDRDLATLGRWALLIEQHYGQPMDIEWAKDGTTSKLYIVQARPETSRSRQSSHTMLTYRVRRTGKLLLTGLAVGEAAATGRVCKLHSPKDVAKFPEGAILVAKVTDPDWVPVMRRAAAIVTEQGGRTSHAAIVSREFGLPAVIGTGNALSRLADGAEITVSCAEGDEGRIYEGKATIDSQEMNATHLPRTKTQVMLNIANPAASLHWWKLPTDGIGLARMEFIISNHIKIHPLALARFSKVRDASARKTIEKMTRGYPSKADYFIDRLATGVARLAASQFPRPVIVRMSDFKTNEYAALIGGAQFEPKEENPMIGWRGASRYYSPDYMDGFALECRALAKARKMGFSNIIVMIPFCRTTQEADQVLKVMARHGLKRHQNGLQVYVMCEIPSNVIQAEEFARRFDGFSIGSNDLTQLTLGVDRDSERLAGLFREDNPAVVSLIRSVIKTGKKTHRKVGFCGQAPSNDPKYARLLVEAGIDSISVTPDSFVAVKRNVAAAERRK